MTARTRQKSVSKPSRMKNAVRAPSPAQHTDLGLRDLVADAASRELAGQAHGEIGRALKDGFSNARTSCVKDNARGDHAASCLSGAVDAAISALFAAAIDAVPGAKGNLSIVAIGGYGRGVLAPFSDIDLLILQSIDADDAIKPFLNSFLYPLWDAGVKIGHAVHTPVSAVEFAKADLIGQTAYLDARFLAGDEKLFEDFSARYQKLRKRTKRAFVEAKLAEQEERHERAKQTRYIVEPNIKEGKGGLRDLHTISWIYRYAYGRDLEKNPDKIIGADNYKALRKAASFLWSVRVNLHDVRGRADEILSFDVQPIIAERLGYVDRNNMTAAERLMRHYFVYSVEIGRLTRILCAKLEEKQTVKLPRLPKILSKELAHDEAPGKPNLRIHQGRLDFESRARAAKRPLDFFRLFRAFAKRPALDFHPDALSVVAANLRLVTSKTRADPVVAKVFLATLTGAKDPVKTLRVMSETGLLGKYLPSFGKLIGRIEFGLYRRFTLNEHTIQAIGILSKIDNGGFAKKHPVTTNIMASAPDKRTFYLAVLLHEVIQTVKDGSKDAGEALVARISRRLGLSSEDSEIIGWCAARPLLMVRIAESRNLSEAGAIIRFAKFVGSKRKLDHLLVISVCHLRVVDLYVWDDWTRRQLTELYQAAKVWLDGGDEALERRLDNRAQAARRGVLKLLEDWSQANKDWFFDRITRPILRSVEPAMIARFAHLMLTAHREGADHAVIVKMRDGDLEAVIYGEDRVGILADLAGVIASAGASVREVRALTTRDGNIIDVFSIQSLSGEPIEDPAMVENLHRALLSAAKARPAKKRNLNRRLGDRRHIFSVEPRVRLDLETSDDCTIIEAEGLDRPGLLFHLAAALSEIGVLIKSANVTTYGERAVDAFYIQDAPGYKITDKRRLQSIERRLLAVLVADDK